MQRFVVQPTRRGFVDYFDQDLTDEIAGLRLDLMLRYRIEVVGGPILQLPRIGVWSFSHGDKKAFFSMFAPGFWESATAAPVTGATLRVLTDLLSISGTELATEAS